MLYDSFFKEIMNPEYTPERLNSLLSLLIGEEVTIKEVLPNDSTRISDESSLVILDIFINMLHNKGITNKLDAWLAFLASDLPEDIIEVIDKYPEFKALYDDVYVMCLNTEKVMNMFSKELSQLDKNTVQYMIDEMQTEIDGMKHELEEKDNVIINVINEKDSIISEKDKEIARLKRKLNEK